MVRRWTARLFLFTLVMAASTLLNWAPPNSCDHFRLDFNQNGIFPPEENPNTEYFSPPVGHIPEHDAFQQVVGGLLEQRMTSLNQPNNGISRYQSCVGQVDRIKDFVQEVRLRVLAAGQDGMLCFFARDSSGNFVVDFTANGVQLADGTQVLVDHSVFHTYRIRSTDNKSRYELDIDGTFAASAAAGPVLGGENAFAFGDSDPGGVGWDVDYDSVTYTQFSSTSVPALSPGGVVLVAVLLFAAGMFVVWRSQMG